MRVCVHCQDTKPISEYYAHAFYPDGLNKKCKECCKQYERDKRAAEKKRVEQNEVTPRLHVLYVMQNPLIPGMVKIGRATCPVQRAYELSRAQPFRLVVCHMYKDWGYLETYIHAKLERRRVNSGTGREWFSVEPWQADTLIRAAILEHELLKS